MAFKSTIPGLVSLCGDAGASNIHRRNTKARCAVSGGVAGGDLVAAVGAVAASGLRIKIEGAAFTF
jgi:hypothetical protein